MKKLRASKKKRKRKRKAAKVLLISQRFIVFDCDSKFSEVRMSDYQTAINVLNYVNADNLLRK